MKPQPYPPPPVFRISRIAAIMAAVVAMFASEAPAQVAPPRMSPTPTPTPTPCVGAPAETPGTDGRTAGTTIIYPESVEEVARRWMHDATY